MRIQSTATRRADQKTMHAKCLKARHVSAHFYLCPSSPPEKVVLSLVSFRLHVRHQSLSSNSTAFSLCLPPLGFLNSHENVWRGDTAHLAFSPGPCDPPTVFDDATACNNSECQKAVGCISRPQLLVRVGDIVEADSCTQTLPCMHMNSAANTHKHTLACMHAHRTLFKEVCFFLLLPFPFSGLPTFPECPGCAAKEPCLLCARDSPNPALFCPDSWFSLSLSLSLIFTARVLALTRRLFSQFSPPLTAKCGPCECKHAEGRDIS